LHKQGFCDVGCPGCQMGGAKSEARKLACVDVTGGPLPCGHYPPKKAPDPLLEEILSFITFP
jgi:hypothetical protein